MQHANSKVTGGRRMANGVVALRVPLDVIKAKCAPYRRHGKPWHRPAMQNLDDFDIVKAYGAEYRGVARYYLLANDVWRLYKLQWDAQTSMLKTLAARHQSSVAKMAAKHKAKVETPYGLRTCYEARVERKGKQALVARFGGVPPVRKKEAVIFDRAPSHQVTYPSAGQPAWAALMARGGARPLWSATPATTPPMTGNRPPKRRSHRGATCIERCQRGKGGSCVEKGLYGYLAAQLTQSRHGYCRGARQRR